MPKHSLRSLEKKSPKQKKKTCFDLGMFLYSKNCLKAPKKPKTCLGRRGRRRGGVGDFRRRKKILKIQEKELPHDLVLVWTTKGWTGTPSGQHMGLAQLGNPAEFGNFDILHCWNFLPRILELHSTLTETSQLNCYAGGYLNVGTSQKRNY